MKRLLASIALVLVLAGNISLVFIGSVSAQTPPPGDARCVVVNYGPLGTCPPQSNALPGSCNILDSSAVDPALRKWAPIDCNDQRFIANSQRPATIACNGDPQAGDEVRDACDPAFACGRGGNANTCNLTVAYINPLIKALSAVVGIAVAVAIIWGGIQYSTSADDPQKVSAAKRLIFNAILTLIGYFLFFQFLNWVVPGGI